MLCGLLDLPGSFPHSDDAVPLPANRRRILCDPVGARTHPLAPATCSAAARLGRFMALARPDSDEEKGNSTKGFYEIPIDDHGSAGNGRHRNRDFHRGRLLRRRLLPGQTSLLRKVSTADS